jgi:hypothetical protein
MLLNTKVIGTLSYILLLLSGSLNGCSTGKPARDTSISSDVQTRLNSSLATPTKEESSQSTDEKLGQKRMGLQGGVIIQGDVVRVEHDSYFVKEKGGEEVRLAIDRTTERIEPIKEGDRIVATVDKQNHALSIHKVP